MTKQLNRRELLRKSITSATVIGAGIGSLNASANACRLLTPAQTEGPFYPENLNTENDTDLTWVKGAKERALGEVIILKGKVLDKNCKPIKGAIVEIWQACASGKYNHSQDPNNAKFDPNFQYWGRSISNENGEYEFTTIKPGTYTATQDWVRPPHIHMKVHLRGFEELTTQVYFKEDALLNGKDRILQSTQNKESLIVDFKKNKERIREGHMAITLNAL